MFFYEFTICGVAPESAINFSLSCSWFYISAINSSLQTTSSATLFADSFSAFFFLQLSFLFFIVHFAIIVFLLVIFVLVVLCFLFPYFFPEVFLDVPRFVAVITFLARLHLLHDSSIFFWDRIYRKLCRYPRIRVLRRGIFHLLLKFLGLIIRSFVLMWSRTKSYGQLTGYIT